MPKTTKADLEAELERIRQRDGARMKRWRETNAAAEAERRKQRNGALAAIKAAYPDEYAELVAEERESDPTISTLYRRAGTRLREAHRDEYDAALAEQT